MGWGGIEGCFFFFFLLFLSFSHFYRCPEANSKFSQPRALLSNKTVTEANFFCCCYFLGYFFFFLFFILSRILVSKNKMISDTRYTDRLGATFTTAWDHFFP